MQFEIGVVTVRMIDVVRMMTAGIGTSANAQPSQPAPDKAGAYASQQQAPRDHEDRHQNVWATVTIAPSDAACCTVPWMPDQMRGGQRLPVTGVSGCSPPSAPPSPIASSSVHGESIGS